MHCRTNGGLVIHPRRAHNLEQIIVCYNYHSAELRVRGLPKMGHWYICTLAHLYFGTSVSPLFPLLSYRWGTHYRTNGGCCDRHTSQPFLRPIVVQMGDALSYKWGNPLSTFGGRIIVQMGDAAIDILPSPSYAPLSYKWGMLP